MARTRLRVLFRLRANRQSCASSISATAALSHGAANAPRSSRPRLRRPPTVSVLAGGAVVVAVHPQTQSSEHAVTYLEPSVAIAAMFRRASCVSLAFN